ncbi:MAG TPA: ABC transporter ATP-binding protein [Chloroflexota bacterium]|nr:ABC transporter ATP-binding protein [Chloroflexota bacterium]
MATRPESWGGDDVPAIEARDIVKRFGALVANDHVSLQAYSGRVLALVGENGAGKSTLMNVLSGLLQPDEGEIRVKGKAVRFRSPRDGIEAGIGMVHQHFMLIPPLTVAENVVLGHEPPGVVYDRAAARRKVTELSEAYGLKLNPDTRVQNLSVGLQQRVEIMKVLYWGSDILIFDEPTAVLTPQETRELFVVLRGLAQQGRTIIFITHKLKEVMAISDHITVLRGGRVVGDIATSRTSAREIAGMMIGRDLTPEVHHPPAALGEPVLQIHGLEVESDLGVPAVRGVDLDVRAGEILGIAGVEGNGQSELVDALMGVRKTQAGSARVNGVELLSGGTPFRTLPAHSRRAGVAVVPEDRRERGLVLPYSVADNLILGMQDTRRFSRLGVLSFTRIRVWARDLVGRFDVRPRRTDIPAGNLSGGNQQKVVLAREFSEDPALLIAAQPTRGLDVGAAEFVHQRLVEKRDAGTAILLVSAELDEILALSDRIAVMYEGRVMHIFNAGEASENEIGLLMTGGAAATEVQRMDTAAPALTSEQ